MNKPEEQSSFKPCVGDLVMKGHAEGATAACGVILRIYEDDFGDRFYFVQMNRALILLRGPERITQEEFDRMGFHPATKQEWQQDMKEVNEWYEEDKARLYEAIKPFIEQ